MPASKRVQDDDALIRACRAGDGDAWEQLIRRYRRLIYSVPVAFRLPRHEADEIFQRVAVKLFENLHRIRDVGSLPSWIAVTARRECIGLSHSEGRFRDLDEADLDVAGPDPPDVAGALQLLEDEHALALALERLDRGCRDLISALYIEDPTPSYQEISARVGRPIGSLGPTRARCLEKLRKLYFRSGGKDPNQGR